MMNGKEREMKTYKYKNPVGSIEYKREKARAYVERKQKGKQIKLLKSIVDIVATESFVDGMTVDDIANSIYEKGYRVRVKKEA